MAIIKVSADQDWRATHGSRRSIAGNPRTIILELVFLVFIATGFIVGQYLFSAFALFILVVFAWLMHYTQRLTVDRRHFLNRFWKDELEVEFSERVFKVSVGLNKLTLAVADIASLREREGFYHLLHDSGFELLIPANVLSTDEVCFLESYKIQVQLRDRESKYLKRWLSGKASTRSTGSVGPPGA